MSNAVSVCQDKWHEGQVLVRDAGLHGMITLKGDLDAESFAKAVKSAVGLAVPNPSEIKMGAKGKAAWMAPDELMLFCEYERADDLVAKLEKALAEDHALAVNVSDARAIFRLEGAAIRNLLAKGTPTPLEGFGPGQFRRSRIGQVAAAFWMEDKETGYIVCFRSVGEHMFNWLSTANSNDAVLHLYA